MTNSVNKSLIVAGSKVGPGEFNGREKAILDSYDLDVLGIAVANNLEVDSLVLPEGAIIVDAWVKSPSMGATGIFQLGLRSHLDKAGATVAEDSDGLVASADAGGQAVFQRNGVEALIGQKIGKGGAELFLKCIEVSVAITGIVKWKVAYLLP